MGGSHFKLPTVGSTGLTWPLLAQSNGTAAAPAFSFAGATGNGMWYQGSNTLGWSTNGALAMTLDASGNLTVTGSATLAAAGLLKFLTRSTLQSTADGFLMMQNAAGTGFTGLRWGGATASFPMLKASGTTLAARLADDSADAPLSASLLTLSGNLALGASSFAQWGALTKLSAPADGDLMFTKNDGTLGGSLYWGPATSAGMRIRQSGGTFFFERGDGGSASGAIQVSTTASVGGMVSANTNNTSNTGLALGSASSGVRLDYTGTAGVYKLRNTSGTDGQGWVIQGMYTVAKTTNYTVVAADSGTHFSNGGAAGSVQFTLPTPVAGYAFHFSCVAAQVMTVVTPSGSIFGPGSLTGATRTITGTTASQQYSGFSVVSDGTNYYMRNVAGTVT